MANVGILIMGIRANYSALSRDVAAVKRELSSLKNVATPTLITPPSTDTINKFSKISKLAGTLFHRADLGVLQGWANTAGLAAKASAALGPEVGIALAAAAVAAGTVVAGFTAIKHAATSAMVAVDAAFKMGSNAEIIKALSKIVSAGGKMGVNITLADTQKVQAVNESLAELGMAFKAVGVQIVAEWQPAILGALDAVRDFAIEMGSWAKYVAGLAKGDILPKQLPTAETAINTARGTANFSQTMIELFGKAVIRRSLDRSKAGDVLAEIKPADKPTAMQMLTPAALEGGTAAQYSASLAARRETADPVLAEARKQTSEQQRTNALLWSIDAALSERAARHAMVGI